MSSFLFLLGLIIGSFINALAYRTENNKSMLTRSACPKCKKQIAWFDNIPLLSYLLLRGKCRHCHKPISIQYPLVELLTGIMFALVGLFSKPGIALSQLFNDYVNLTNPQIDVSLLLNICLFMVLLLVTGCLLLVAIYDLKTKEIPNSFNFVFVGGSFLYLLTSSITAGLDSTRLIQHLFTALLIFLIFWGLVYFSHETWMGGGDSKFVIGMGLLLGPAATLLAVFLASITGSIFGIGNLLIQKKKLSPKSYRLKATHEVPFGPFLALGTFISLLFSSEIVDWYAKIFLGI